MIPLIVSCYGAARDLHSFPTRRSSDLLRFFGEALRQAGVLILSSTIVIWGLVFIIGLQCGIEGAYFNRSVGSPAYAGRSEEHTSELQSQSNLVCRLLLEKKKPMTRIKS